MVYKNLTYGIQKQEHKRHYHSYGIPFYKHILVEPGMDLHTLSLFHHIDLGNNL